MFLHKLKLQQYRNFDNCELNFYNNINLFIGPNAQGKTNVLESIFVLALSKSHRTYHDKELIKWQSERNSLYCEVEKRYGNCQLELQFSQQGKKAKINGIEQSKLSQFIGTLNVVMFAPEDLNIVKGSPGVRRRFMDMEIGQVHPGYLYDLNQYQKLLQQKNSYLKQMSGTSDLKGMLDIWNEQLALFGIKIMKKRQHFIKKLQNWAEKIHFGISNQSEKLQIVYSPSFDIEDDQEESVLIDRFMVKLSQVKNQEIKRGQSLVGPHRDDILFYINDKEVQIFGSQGQQRTTALSLKLAEIELIHEDAGEYPLLLLDDVLSELDQNRQTQLIETFQRKVQTFITATGIESIHLNKLDQFSIFQVSNGQVRS